MAKRETRDFISVETFSQLPFIRRPAPTSCKEKNSSTRIRIFGIEVPREDDGRDEGEVEPEPEPEVDSSTSTSKENATTGGSPRDGCTPTTAPPQLAGESSRKFECHYCCRNFPTSQALGGHQNAHKRERQHAKRAHLQSALAAAHHHHHNTVANHDASLYGFVNYHRLPPSTSSSSSSSPSSRRFNIGHAFDYPLTRPPHYPNSWRTDLTGSGSSGNYIPPAPSIYGAPGSASHPINGNPVPGIWRVSVLQGRETQIPFHNPNHSTTAPFEPGVSAALTTSSSSFSPVKQTGRRISFEPNSLSEVKVDHLSLDLHL